LAMQPVTERQRWWPTEQWRSFSQTQHTKFNF